MTFDPDGASLLPGRKVLTSMGIEHDYAISIAVQSDGKLVVTGYAFNGSNYDFALARYTANGALDPSFGNGGKVISPIGSYNNFARSMALQSDGKIVLAGYASTANGDDFALARYTTDGVLAPTFGCDGKVISHLGSFEDAAYCIAIQSDGKIVVAGQRRNAARRRRHSARGPCFVVRRKRAQC